MTTIAYYCNVYRLQYLFLNSRPISYFSLLTLNMISYFTTFDTIMYQMHGWPDACVSGKNTVMSDGRQLILQFMNIKKRIRKGLARVSFVRDHSLKVLLDFSELIPIIEAALVFQRSCCSFEAYIESEVSKPHKNTSTV